MCNLKIGLGQLVKLTLLRSSVRRISPAAPRIGLNDLLFVLPLAIEPDAVQTAFSGANDVVQERVSDVHCFFGMAVGGFESGGEDKRSGFALVKLAPDEDIAEILLETGCFHFRPLHAGGTVGEQTHMKELCQV